MLSYAVVVAAAVVLPVGAQTVGGRASGRGEEEGRFADSYLPHRPDYYTVKPSTPSYDTPSYPYYDDYKKEEKEPIIECGDCICECNNTLICACTSVCV